MRSLRDYASVHRSRVLPVVLPVLGQTVGGRHHFSSSAAAWTGDGLPHLDDGPPVVYVIMLRLAIGIRADFFFFMIIYGEA